MTTLDGVTREKPSEEVTFKLKSELQGGAVVLIKMESIPGRRNKSQGRVGIRWE